MIKIFLLLVIVLPSFASAQSYTGNVGVLDIQERIPLALIKGVSSNNKFGRSTDVDAALTDVWDGANTTDNIVEISSRVASSPVNIYSASALDDDGGKGCNTIAVYGVDGDFKRASETVTLNGTSLVATATTYIGIDRMKCVTAGESANVEGNIYALFTVDETTGAMITSGTSLHNQTLMAILYVAADEDALINQYYGNINKSSGTEVYVDFQLVARENATTDNTPFQVKHYGSVTSAGVSLMMHNFDPPIKIIGPATIKMRALGSTANLDVSAGFDVTLVSK